MVVHFLQTCGALTLILHTLQLLSAATLEPYDLLYSSGVEALHRGDYAGVVRYMEKALENFAQLRQTKIQCGLKCSDQHKLDATATELQLFDAILRRADCLNDCIERKLGPPAMHKVTADVVQDFNRRIPYNYLQLAYHKVKRIEPESSVYLPPVCFVQDQGHEQEG